MWQVDQELKRNRLFWASRSGSVVVEICSVRQLDLLKTICFEITAPQGSCATTTLKIKLHRKNTVNDNSENIWGHNCFSFAHTPSLCLFLYRYEDRMWGQPVSVWKRSLHPVGLAVWRRRGLHRWQRRELLWWDAKLKLHHWHTAFSICLWMR